MTTIVRSGSRKSATARASLKAGKGRVVVNNRVIDLCQPKLYRMRMQEPLMLAGDVAKGVDIHVNVRGGGVASQADAVRVAIGRALVAHNPELEKQFLDYDRLILVADVRRKETHKPNRHGKARAKRQKSYR